MLNDLRFEWIKAKKSNVFILFISACFILTLVFFGVQSSQQSLLYEEHSLLLNREVSNLETDNQLLRESNEELKHDDMIENADEIIRFHEENIAFNNHLIPFARATADAFDEGNYEVYYISRMWYLKESARANEFIDYSHIVVGEIDEGLPESDQHEFDTLAAFLSASEPMENEQVSLTAPNHIVLLARLFMNPFVLIILVLLISLVLVEEVSEDSLTLQLTETEKPIYWFFSNRLFSTSLFIFGLLTSFMLSFALLNLFGRPLFDTAPSWGAPIVLNDYVHNQLTILTYFILIMVILIVAFLFLHQLFTVILLYVKKVMLSVIVFFTISLLGFFFTQAYQTLLHWSNPFALFFINEWLASNQLNELILGLGITCIMSGLLFTVAARKLKHSPLS